MCGPGGKSDEPRGLPAQLVPIELEQSRPRTSARPHTSTKDRPRTSKHTHTSSGENRPQSQRPQSHRRPESERRQRPEGSSHRSKTSEHGRRSSHGGHHAKDRSRHEFPPIEEHTDDRTLLRHLGELTTFIDQHVATFYSPMVDFGDSGIAELDDPRTRYPALQRYIMQRVGDEIIMADRDRYYRAP
jgi:hypothetical protein